SIGVTIDTVALTPPPPDLEDLSDSGISNTDNITNKTTLKIDAVAEPGAVTLYVDGVARGPLNILDSNPVSFTNVGPLADGVHQFTLSVVDLAGNLSTIGAALNVAVDTVAQMPSTPALNAASDSGICGDGITRFTQRNF